MRKIIVSIDCPHCGASYSFSLSVCSMLGVGSNEFYFLPAICQSCSQPVLLYWPEADFNDHVVLPLDSTIMLSDSSTPGEKMDYIREVIEDYQTEEEDTVDHDDVVAGIEVLADEMTESAKGEEYEGSSPITDEDLRQFRHFLDHFRMEVIISLRLPIAQKELEQYAWDLKFLEGPKSRGKLRIENL